MKKETTEAKAQESYIGTLYNYLHQLKINFTEYEDVLLEIEANQTEGEEVEIEETIAPTVKALTKQLRQYISITHMEYQILLKQNKIKHCIFHFKIPSI